MWIGKLWLNRIDPLTGKEIRGDTTNLRTSSLPRCSPFTVFINIFSFSSENGGIYALLARVGHGVRFATSLLEKRARMKFSSRNA